MPEYYDYILGLIPAVMLGIIASLTAVGLPWTVTVPAGAGASVLLIGHALFVNAPVGPSTVPDAAASPVERPAD
ncbi:MAG: hypothetical protein ABEJ79_11895 [Halolamina sp.]